MDELGRAREFRDRGESLLEPIFDRLDVMVGRLLDRLHALGVCDSECGGYVGEQCTRRCRECWNLSNAGLVGERLQPGELNLDAVPYQTVLAEIVRQCRHLAAVPPVERAKRGERRKWNGRVGVSHDDVARGAIAV